MNGFEKHGLKHSSPSAINMFAEAPCAWVARYLFNKKFSFGAAAQIGVLTERVVAEVLCGEELGASLNRAKADFSKENALNPSDKDRARVDDIEAMALQALPILKPYGEPEFLHTIKGREQQKVSVQCKGNGWELPVIGYLDFVYPKHGLVIDLKTTLRIPSEISVSHARQAAIYAHGKGNMDCKMLYVSPKKHAMHGIEDKGLILAEIKAILNRQEKLLALEKEVIKEIIPVNAASFYWGNDQSIRKELYGL